MKIYISIPITGKDEREQRAKAERYAKFIELLGHEPVNPFCIDHGEKKIGKENLTTGDYLGADIRELLKCDAIYLSPGWEQSNGCKLEKSAADIYRIRTFTQLENIPENE